MKKKVMTILMATAITASMVLINTTTSAALNDLSVSPSNYNTIQTTEKITSSGEVSLIITTFSGNVVQTSKGQLTISESLKPIFKSSNRQALTNAKATVNIENNKITEIKMLTFNNIGTSKKPVIFDGGNTEVSGNVIVSGDYNIIKNLIISKELIVTALVKKAITIENVSIGETITFQPLRLKKINWLNATLKDMLSPDIRIQRNKIMIDSDTLISNIQVTDDVPLLEVNADVGKLLIDVNKDFSLNGEGKIEKATVIGGKNVSLDSSHYFNKIQVDNKSAKVTYSIIDKTALISLISSIQYVPINNDNYYNEYYNGYYAYTSEKWTTQAERNAFDTAVSNAQAVANDKRATKEQVQNAISQLNTAINIYKTAQKSYIGDKITLDNLIKSVQYVDVYWYNSNPFHHNAWTTQAEKDALVNAVSSARYVLNNYYASPYEITNAIYNLNNAITTYKNAYKYGNTGFSCDKSELTSLINSIPYVPVSYYGNNLYYDTAWTFQTEREDLDRAVTFALAVETNDTASQYEISNAIYNLNNAISIYKNAYKYGPNGTGSF